MAVKTFISQAHANQASPAFPKFLQGLRQNLRQVGGPAWSDVFCTPDSVPWGKPWPPATREALRTCESMVFLCSADSVESQACGRELYVYLERLAMLGNPAASGPLIVWWSRLPSSDPNLQLYDRSAPDFLPPALCRYQFTSPELPARYHHHGLFGLAQMGWEQEFNQTLYLLAGAIIRAASEWAPPAGRPEVRDGASAFDDLPESLREVYADPFAGATAEERASMYLDLDADVGGAS